MRIVRLEKEYEEELTLPDFKVIRIRNKVTGVLNEEEQSGGAKRIKECADKLYKVARSLTRADIDKEIKLRED